jgi:hypothetical protein
MSNFSEKVAFLPRPEGYSRKCLYEQTRERLVYLTTPSDRRHNHSNHGDSPSNYLKGLKDISSIYHPSHQTHHTLANILSSRRIPSTTVNSIRLFEQHTHSARWHHQLRPQHQAARWHPQPDPQQQYHHNHPRHDTDDPKPDP